MANDGNPSALPPLIIQQAAPNSLLGNNTGSPQKPLSLSPGQVKALLAISTSDINGLLNFSSAVTGAVLTISGALTAARVLTVQDASYTIAGTNISQTFSGVQTYSGSIVLASATPVIEINETDGGIDQKRWRMSSDGQVFRLAAAKDSSDVGSDIFSAYRNREDITYLNLAPSGGKVTIGGYTARMWISSPDDTTLRQDCWPNNPNFYGVSAGAGYAKGYTILTNGGGAGVKLRWSLIGDTDAETGANAGTTLRLLAHTDAGVQIDAPLSIVRAAGGAITTPRPFATGSYLGANNWSPNPLSGQASFGLSNNDYESWDFARTAFGERSGWIVGAYTTGNYSADIGNSFAHKANGNLYGYRPLWIDYAGNGGTLSFRIGNTLSNGTGANSAVAWSTPLTVDISSVRASALVVGTSDPGGPEILRVGGSARFAGTTTCNATLGGVANFVLSEAGSPKAYITWISASAGLGTRNGRLEIDRQFNRFVITDGGSIDRFEVSASGAVIVGADPGGPEIFRVGGSARFNGSLKVGTSNLYLESPSPDQLRLIADAGSSSQFTLSAAAGQYRSFLFATNGSYRWSMGATDEAETGASAGSSWRLNAFTDAGGYIDSPIRLDRPAGSPLILSRPLRLASAYTAGAPAATGYVTIQASNGTTYKVLVST
jgi:hypothetical protein